MDEMQGKNHFNQVLLLGQGRLTASVAACFAIAGSDIIILSQNPERDYLRTQNHINDYQLNTGTAVPGTVRFVEKVDKTFLPSLVIIVGIFDPGIIQILIRDLENLFGDKFTVAVATDFIPLSEIQQYAKYPENILVLNWTEPAHTTFFMEIVHNRTTKPEAVSLVENAAKAWLGKDPYTVYGELGIRGKMQAALFREAIFLVENGYANVGDIDRACRNDAGTFLPFTGHFRYMDLMGTYAYGVVMEELNRDLSNTKIVPATIKHLVEEGHGGMTGGEGFYKYREEEVKEWEQRIREFSFEIRKLMEKSVDS